MLLYILWGGLILFIVFIIHVCRCSIRYGKIQAENEIMLNKALKEKVNNEKQKVE